MHYFGNRKQFIYFDSSNRSKNSGSTNYSKRTFKGSKFSSFVKIKWEFHLIYFHLQLILEPMNELVIIMMATIPTLNTNG